MSVKIGNMNQTGSVCNKVVLRDELDPVFEELLKSAWSAGDNQVGLYDHRPELRNSETVSLSHMLKFSKHLFVIPTLHAFLRVSILEQSSITPSGIMSVHHFAYTANGSYTLTGFRVVMCLLVHERD